MKTIKRNADRYIIFGRAEAPDICQIPGVLADISKAGCKLRFPLPVSIDMDYDYTVRITFSENTKTIPFVLICHPQWVKEENGSTEIGCTFLRSPDTARLLEYVQKLKNEEDDYRNSENFVIEDVCQFV